MYDGANCYYGIHAPSGSRPFVYQGGFYWNARPGIFCAGVAWFDGAHCYAGYGGLKAFVYNNAFYSQPTCE